MNKNFKFKLILSFIPSIVIALILLKIYSAETVFIYTILGIISFEVIYVLGLSNINIIQKMNKCIFYPLTILPFLSISAIIWIWDLFTYKEAYICIGKYIVLGSIVTLIISFMMMFIDEINHEALTKDEEEFFLLFSNVLYPLSGVLIIIGGVIWFIQTW